MLRKLAVGGMAELFLAERADRSGPCVIKRILPHLSGEPEFVQMFLDEARIAAQLHHPNVVQVFELGRLGGSLFIAMEYVEGADLRKIYREEAKEGRGVPFGIAARIAADACAGLHYAHRATGVDGAELHVVHRDISPQNVMVSFAGETKLVDFGIAKAGRWVDRSKPGVIKGKFLYLAPEVVGQEEVDHRADLFAMGALLYEVTTGKSPFHKPSTEAVIYAIRTEEPPRPDALRPDYPKALADIVMRCLVKDKTQRIQKASDLRRELQSFLETLSAEEMNVAAYVTRLFKGVAPLRPITQQPIADPVTDAGQAPPPNEDTDPSVVVPGPARPSTGELLDKTLGVMESEEDRIVTSEFALPPEAGAGLPSAPSTRPAPTPARLRQRRRFLVGLGIAAVVGLLTGVLFWSVTPTPPPDPQPFSLPGAGSNRAR
ncbi:MAG: serine/threonine protein kinase [Myxococcaceae bacterium]